MKLSSKRVDSEYMPSEGIFTFPEGTELPFFFDVNKELANNPSAIDAVGEMLDGARTLAERAKAAIKTALTDESSPYHDLMAFFVQFYRDDVGPDIAADLLPRTDPAELSFIGVVDFLRLKRFDNLMDGETGQQAFILDLSFSPEITDELMMVYFDLNKEIFCIIHES